MRGEALKEVARFGPPRGAYGGLSFVADVRLLVVLRQVAGETKQTLSVWDVAGGTVTYAR